MNEPTKNPPPAATGVGLDHNTQPLHPATAQAPRQLRAATKLYSVLAELARGTHLNRFTAEKVCQDHTLNSTICEIQNRGIIVARKDITVPGYRGKPTHCAEYWLTPEEIEKSAVLLGWKAWREQG